MISTYFPQRFIVRGNDGGSYFVRQDNPTSTIWWYGEDPALNWAHVYSGQLISDEHGDRWDGMFIDVPKGLTCANGNLNWRVASPIPGLPIITRTTRITPFAGSVIGPVLPGIRVPSAGVARRIAGFVGQGLDNLTGVWLGDDGGTYYLRQVSETGQIAWVGENPEAEPSTEGHPGNSWSNVLIGQRIDRRIDANWSDVPKGEINRAGHMHLEIESADLIRIVNKTGGFGGNEFHRIDEFGMQLRFNTLTIVDQQEWFFEADEPYFLALIALMDGHTVDLTNPSGSSVDFRNSLVAPNLGSNLSAGTVVPLTSLPVINMSLRPVPGDTGDHPILGIALRGAERDFSGDAWRAGRLRDWINTGGSELNRNLQRGEAINFGTDVARWHETFSWANEDDLFGLSTRNFTFNDLISSIGSSIPMTFALRGGDVRYDVSATLTVTGARGNCRP